MSQAAAPSPVVPPASSPPAAPDGRFPRQIKYIVGNEACERFSYYGMRSVLALYITSVLARTDDQATEIIHYFIFANYFMPLIGAWLSDRVWGRYHTILWVSLFYCAGHGVLATSDLIPGVEGKTWCLYAGLALIAFGSGGIKPCVSAFVGDQFRPDQSHLLQKAYGAFYWSINFGSFFSFLVIPWIKGRFGYGWAFGVPGILMGLATLIFWLGTRHYTRVPPSRATRSAGFFRILAYAVAHRGERRTGQGFWDVARGRFSKEEVDGAASVGPILGVFAMIPPFWALFDQSTSTWVLQGAKMQPMFVEGYWILVLVGILGAAQVAAGIMSRGALARWLLGGILVAGALLGTFMKQGAVVFPGWGSAALGIGVATGLGLVAARVPVRVVGALLGLSGIASIVISGIRLARGAVPEGFTVSAEQMQSANPALVMLLVPVVTLGVYPIVGRLATPLRRMGAGLVLAAASFVIVGWIQQRLESGQALNLAWQIVPYVVLTAGEVLLSTTGLEFAFTEAGKEMKSTIMSFWLLTVAFGNLMVSWITKLAGGGDPSAAVSSGRFYFYALLTFLVAGIFAVIAMFYRYRNPANALGTPARA